MANKPEIKCSNARFESGKPCRGPGGAHENKLKFLQLMVKHDGHITKSITELGLKLGTYYNWIESDNDFRASVHEFQEKLLDDAEECVKNNIRINSLDAAKFVLARKGKGRGWSEKLEVDGNISFNAADVIRMAAEEARKKMQTEPEPTKEKND